MPGCAGPRRPRTIDSTSVDGIVGADGSSIRIVDDQRAIGAREPSGKATSLALVTQLEVPSLPLVEVDPLRGDTQRELASTADHFSID